MSDHRDSTPMPKSIGELTENIVQNLRAGISTAAEGKRKETFELRMVPDSTDIAELNIDDIEELAFSVRALIHVSRLALRDVYDGVYHQTPDDLPAIDRALSVTFDLARELTNQIVEIGPSQLETPTRA